MNILSMQLIHFYMQCAVVFGETIRIEMFSNVMQVLQPHLCKNLGGMIIGCAAILQTNIAI